MLYKHLFDVHAKDTFDWSRFFEHIKINPSEPLSDGFVAQSQVICESSDLTAAASARNLGDLVAALQSCHTHAGTLQENMELVYRWREPVNPFDSPTVARRRRTRKPPAGTASAPTAEVIDLTAEEPAQSAQASPSVVVSATSPGQLERAASAPAGEIATASPTQSVAQPVPQTPAKAETTAAADAASAHGTPATPIDLREISQKTDLIQTTAAGTIIGTEPFTYDQEKLFAYLDNAISFWQGRVSS